MVLQVFLWVNIHPFRTRTRTRARARTRARTPAPARARTRMIGIALRNGVDLPQHPHVCAS
jgi:hypothetical protein